MNDIVATLIFTVVVVVTAVVSSNAFEAAACTARWASSGVHSDYTFLKGCMLEIAPDRWIPAESFISNLPERN